MPHLRWTVEENGVYGSVDMSLPKSMRLGGGDWAKPYLTRYDAIIPLIAKLPEGNRVSSNPNDYPRWMFSNYLLRILGVKLWENGSPTQPPFELCYLIYAATPAQLAEAVLRALRMWDADTEDDSMAGRPFYPPGQPVPDVSVEPARQYGHVDLGEVDVHDPYSWMRVIKQTVDSAVNQLEAEQARETCLVCQRSMSPSLIESRVCVFCTCDSLKAKLAAVSLTGGGGQ